MSTFKAGQRINHPSLVGIWLVTHDQPLPNRHINVVQGSNSAQVTAAQAKLKEDNEQIYLYTGEPKRQVDR